MSFKQNVEINTKDGVVKIFRGKCISCKYYGFCYLDEYGHYHKGTPKGLDEECFNR